MPAPPQPGPFTEIPVPGGTSAPLYLIPFDKEGRCVGPNTLAHLMQAAVSGPFTDIHLYSHGWNNVFKEAVSHYTEFFTEYFALRAQVGLHAADYRPLLVGIIWPSTVLVSGRDQTPGFAATEPIAERAAALEADLAAMQDLASELDPADTTRFFELIDRPQVNGAEALELARMLLPLMAREGADREGIPQKTTPESLVQAWGALEDRPVQNEGKPGALPEDDDELGVSVGMPGDAGATDPRTAGWLDLLNPKNVVRAATVRQMKDRAGRVGARGVAPMLHALLTKTAAANRPIHLTGHSYGAKVMLSALTAIEPPRNVRSVLLLQPAVNAFCFADAIAEQDNAEGGFRSALFRTDLPILATFSRHDSPLTRFFHLALRRADDLGEQQRMAAGPPSRFAALGGFGPGGMKPGESTTIGILQPPRKYDFSNPAIRLIALDGGTADRINGHGDVRNEFTEWAMINLVSGSRLS